MTPAIPPLPVPGKPWFTFFATEFFMDVYGLPFSVENQVKVLSKVRRGFKPDLYFPRMDLDEFATLFGGPARGPGCMTASGLAAADPGDLVRVPSAADVRETPSWRVLDAVGPTLDDTSERAGCYVPAPYSLLTSIAGLQPASEALITAPDAIARAMPVLSGAIVAYIDAMAGIPGTGMIVILAPSECTISRRMYKTFVAGPMLDVIRAAARTGIPTFMHFCSPDNAHLVNEEIVWPMRDAGLAGLNVPRVVEAVPLATSLGLALFGGLDPIQVQRDHRVLVLDKAREMIDGTRSVSFILGTNCQVKRLPRVSCTGALLTKFMELRKLAKGA